MIRLKSLVLLVLCFNVAFGFLPTRLNFDDPDFSDIFCDTSGETTDLKAITREGIRREIINLFNEDPPVGSSGFFVPEDATLSEMFHMYYGDESSATRFYKAVNTIAWSNADVDSMESTKYDTRYHFDGEKLHEAQALLTDRHNLIVSSLISNQSYDFARQQIGFSLHAIQDFYSHTNWYELGNENILQVLGMPGYTIPNVAGIDEEVCRSCSSETGSCVANVLDTGKLTSGYYEYDVTAASPFIVDKPSGGGKCSFGGSLDTSKSADPIGGINKATRSSCFSPHSYLHDAAVNLATEATQFYLSVIRDAIGNEKFKFLFDLYEGSALVIVIDTTGSMGGEILAVQQEVDLIVQTTPAELYILVPYGDPTFGPVTKTTDSQVFLDAVNRLGPYGGGDQPEMVWSALELALVETPDYSTLYLFTDAGGKDFVLMNGDFALAQQKNIRCTTVFSYLNDQLSGAPYTDDTDYMNLAAATGGQYIIINDFAIDNVISIIDNGVDSTVVTLALRRDVTGAINFDAVVDETVHAWSITISGTVDSATVTDPNGGVYDLKDLDALNAALETTVVAYTPTLIDVSFASPIVGSWNIQISSAGNYSATADGVSTLGYIVEFTELDIRPPRPNYKLIRGQPIIGMTYYVETTLVGWIDSSVTSVATMQFLDKAGNILSEILNTEPVDDEFYIKSEPLPAENFYVVANGFLASGNPFTRVYETLMSPTVVVVDVDLSRSVLAAPPDSTVEAYFDVTNLGSDATYNYYASDDESYIIDFQPKSSFILSGGTQVVTVTLYVPPDAIPWTESTIIVTAFAEADYSIVNSNIAYFIVLPEVRDQIAPTCVRNDEPDCAGFSSSTNCDQSTWTVSATLHDTDSGLAAIYSQPSNSETDLDTSSFVPGTTDDVTVSLTSSCCITSLLIIGVDQQGNIGVCDYDIGTLDGVLTFEAIDEGSTWVNLRWTVSDVRVDLFKYTIQTDFGFNNDIACFDTVCFYNKTTLTPCSDHHFELTPYFDPNFDFNLVEGSTAITDDTTLDQVPAAPTNGVAMTGSESTIVDVSWDAPADARCIFLYEVCYVIAGSLNVSESTLCLTTPDTSISITSLAACSLYSITVRSQTVSGLTSDTLDIDASSGDAAPGAPTNFMVVDMTAVSASLSWDPPAINPECAFAYDLTAFLTINVASPKENLIIIYEENDGLFGATVSPLIPCTNYTFVVYAVSSTGLNSPDAITYGVTDESIPDDPSNLDLTATGTTSIHATWNSGSDICVDHYELCYDDPVTFTEICAAVYGNSYDITGLRSCTLYSVSVVAVTPDGVFSSLIRAIAATDDDVPGAPTNLIVSSMTPSTVTIEFDPPTLNPQCVDEYDIEYIDLDLNSVPEEMEGKASNTNTLTGLEACTDIQVLVTAVSPQGLESPNANASTTTSEALPSAPSNLVVVVATSDTIELRWFAPVDNHKCATRYLVVWLSGGGANDSGQVPVLAKAQYEFQYTMTELTACTSYNILVTGQTDGIGGGTTASTIGSTTC